MKFVDSLKQKGKSLKRAGLAGLIAVPLFLQGCAGTVVGTLLAPGPGTVVGLVSDIAANSGKRNNTNENELFKQHYVDLNNDGIQDLTYIAITELPRSLTPSLFDKNKRNKRTENCVINNTTYFRHSLDQYVAYGKPDGSFSKPKKIFHYDKAPVGF